MPVPDSGASFWLCICIHVHGTWAGLGVCLSHGQLTVLSVYRHVPQVAMMGTGTDLLHHCSPLLWTPRRHPIITPSPTF